MKIGIAICTFNRIHTLRETIAKIQTHTKSDYNLIVIDDGSSDGTIEELEELGVTFLSCRNRGIAWNKNRAIFYLKNFIKADAIIIFEDDTFPIEDNWEINWVKGIDRWGHINLAARYWGGDLFHDGNGTPERPFKSNHVSAQCAGFSSECIEYVGYMDSRFRGYGMEHIEHTNRIVEAGFGGEALNITKRPIYYLIDSPMEILFRDVSVGLDDEEKKKEISKSVAIYMQIKSDKIHRDPWINDEEMSIFLSEYNKFRIRKLYFQIRTEEKLVLCFNSNSAKMLFLSDEDLFRSDEAKKVLSYYDGNKLRLCVRSNGNIHYLGKSSITGINLQEVGDKDEIIFDVILDEKAGMYLRCDGVYASCEKPLGNILSLNRTDPSDWERFYFSYFEII